MSFLSPVLRQQEPPGGLPSVAPMSTHVSLTTLPLTPGSSLPSATPPPNGHKSAAGTSEHPANFESNAASTASVTASHSKPKYIPSPKTFCAPTGPYYGRQMADSTICIPADHLPRRLHQRFATDLYKRKRWSAIFNETINDPPQTLRSLRPDEVWVQFHEHDGQHCEESTHDASRLSAD